MKTKYLFVALFAGTLGFSGVGFSRARADLPERLQHFVHRVFSTGDGLPCNSVSALAQDDKGYLWVGTCEGLARFDGSRFEVYDRRAHEGLEAGPVSGIIVDGPKLWFAVTGLGLAVLQGDRLEVFGKTQGLTNTNITSMVLDNRGTVWLATDGGGLFSFRQEKFSQFGELAGLPSSRLTAVALDVVGRLWVGTHGGGLALLEGNRFRVFTTRDGLPSDAVTSLYLGRNGFLFVGTNKGLARLVGGAFETIGYGAGGDLSVRSLSEDRQGRLWVGTHGAGLALLDGEDVSWFTVQDGLGLDFVEIVFQDRDGNTWVGTGAGLDMFRRGPLTTYGPLDSLPREPIQSFMRSRDGAYWIGTRAGGLLRIDQNGQSRHGTDYDGLGSAQVVSLLEDDQGRILAGTDLAGVFVWEGGPPWKPLDPLLMKTRVSAMVQGANGVLWIGSSAGLARMMVGEPIAFYSVEKGLPSENIQSLAFDDLGALWIGTQGGLAVMRGGVIYSMNRGRPLPREAILSILMDGRRIWLGTDSRGILVFDREITRALTYEHGLLGDSVLSMLNDEEGRLWVSSPLGIYSFAKQDVDDLFAGTIHRLNPRIYGPADGLRTRQYLGGNQAAAWKTADGRLWFAMAKGLVAADPVRVGRGLQAPSTRIEDVRIDDVSASLDRAIQLPRAAKKVQVRYSAAGFLFPEHVLFQYRLDGFDENWQDAGHRLVVEYTNIPPGSYRFRVRASTVDADRPGAEATVELQRLAGVHETWWVRFLIFLGGLGLMALVFWLRLHSVETSRQRLSELVTATTEELSQRERELNELALKDSLTGLRNRRYLFEVVAPQAALVAVRNQLATLGLDRRQNTSSGACGLALVNIDNLKKINDVFGHDQGDAVLLAVAKILSQSVRVDDVVVRWGGGEFLVLLENAPLDFLPTFADKIIEAVSQSPVQRDTGDPISLTCSMGLVAFPPSRRFPRALGFDQVIGLADKALFQAKSSGKDRAVLAKVDDNILDSEQGYLDSVNKLEGRLLGRGGAVYFELLPRRGQSLSPKKS
jgi:diguanylate cyclase (GGDEF)-like protein